jgi:hypothetical protein
MPHMPDTESRRKFIRYPVQWSAAVVFDGDNKKPVLLTRTEDLSAGGAAVHSRYEDLTGSMVTLLLDRSAAGSTALPKLLRIRARVVSTERAPGDDKFRHGLGFVRSQDDGLDVIETLIAESGSVAPKDRRQIAREKREQARQKATQASTGVAQNDSYLQRQARISAALSRAYCYLDEFISRLNVEKPVYASTYSMIGVRQFSGLKWEGGSVESRKRQMPSGEEIYEQVSMGFSLASEGKLRVMRDRAGSERLRQVLIDRHVEFTCHDERGARGASGWKTFVLSCKVVAGLQLTGDVESGEIRLNTRNIEEFGEVQYILQPEDLDEASLRELTDRILSNPRH